MKKLLIMRDKTGEKELVGYLKQQLAPEIEVTQSNFSDLVFEIQTGSIEARLAEGKVDDFDFVWLRRVGKKYSPLGSALACFLEFTKTPYSDTSWCKEGLNNKLTSLIKMAAVGLPVPKSLFYCRETIVREKDQIITRLEFPLVAKNIWQNRGKGVFLLKEAKDFEGLINKTSFGDHLLLQKFHPNDGDYRIVVLGNEVRAWEKRTRIADEFRNNAALGGKEEFFPLGEIPLQMKEIAIKAAKVLDLQVAGVDLLIDSKTGEIYILEVNRSPGFTTDLKISTELPAIATFFRQRLSQ